MKGLKKLIGEVEINRALILLLVIGGLYSLSVALSNTFVNIYLWKQSGQFKDIAVYNLSVVVMQPLTFIVAGKWAKKVDRVIVLRLGVIFLSIFYLTVLFIGENSSQFLILLGALLGIGFGFYWLAFNVLTFEITEPETRDFFNGFLGLLTSFAGMIGPIMAGWIISSLENFTGYTVIFSISLSLFSAAVILSLFLKRRSAKGNFSFRRIVLEQKYNENWKNILTANFFQGFREGTFVFVIVVWVFVTTQSELALGTFGLVQSGTAFVFYYLATRLIKPRHRKKAILFGGVTLYAAIFLIIFKLTFTKLLIYAVIISIAYPVLLVPYMSLTYDVIGKGWNAAEMRVEYIVVKELYLNLGRIVSILAFLAAILLFNEEKSIPVLFTILGAGHLIMYFFVRNIELSKRSKSMKRDDYPVMEKGRLVDGEGGSTS